MNKQIKIIGLDIVNNQQPSRQTAPVHASVKRRLSLGQLYRSSVIRLLLVLILASLPSLYFYHANQQTEQKLNGSTSTKPMTTAEVVKRVSRHILLPSGEQPTVFRLHDISNFRSQAFFANAANGDVGLIYVQAKKAYLYRPSIDRIIEVAPLAPSKTGQ